MHMHYFLHTQYLPHFCEDRREKKIKCKYI